MDAYHPIYKVWAVIVIVAVVGIFAYNVIPQQTIPGDPAMTTLYYLSNSQPEVYERDPVFNVPMSIYPRLFLLIRGVFLKLAGGDLLLSVKLLFFTMAVLQVLGFAWLLYHFHRDKWLSVIVAVGMTGFAFLPSTMTWGFEDIYQVSNRQIFWIIFPIAFLCFVKTLDQRKRFLLFFLLGIFGNSHPGQAINAFIILSVVLLVMRRRQEKVMHILTDLFKGWAIFSLAIIPTVCGFFQVGEKIQVVGKRLSPAEIDTIVRMADWTVHSTFFWLRFLANPYIFGVLLFIILRYLLDNYTDFRGRGNNFSENDTVGSVCLLTRAKKISAWGLLVTPIVCQAMGLITTWGYYALFGRLSSMAALYRADRFFIFFAHCLFFCFLVEMKQSNALTRMQKTFLTALSFFAIFSAYGVGATMRIIPVSGFYDYANMAWLSITNVTILITIFFIGKYLLKNGYVLLKRSPASVETKVGDGAVENSVKHLQIRIPMFVAIGMVLLLLGIHTEKSILIRIKNLISPSPKYIAHREEKLGIVLSEVIEWTLENTKYGDMFWFDGFYDYRFKAQSRRPTLGTMSTAETLWLISGDQAALDHVAGVDRRQRILDDSDWKALQQICESRKVQYVVLDKSIRGIVAPGYDKVFENKNYVIFKTDIPQPVK